MNSNSIKTLMRMNTKHTRTVLRVKVVSSEVIFALCSGNPSKALVKTRLGVVVLTANLFYAIDGEVFQVIQFGMLYYSIFVAGGWRPWNKFHTNSVWLIVLALIECNTFWIIFGLQVSFSLAFYCFQVLLEIC